MSEKINLYKNTYKSNIAKLVRFYADNVKIISRIGVEYPIDTNFILDPADITYLETSIYRFGIAELFYRTKEGQKYLKSDFPDYRFIIKRIGELQELLQRAGVS